MHNNRLTLNANGETVIPRTCYELQTHTETRLYAQMVAVSKLSARDSVSGINRYL